MPVRKLPCLLFTALLATGYATNSFGAKPTIEPQAEQSLRRMSDFLKSQSRFSFHIDATYEAVERGQKVQFSAVTTVLVQRPDRLQVDAEGDTLKRRFWYDGKTMTVLDAEKNNYAATEMAGDLDSMLDRIRRQYGLSLPAADFVVSDPYQALTANATDGFYVGRHNVQGVPCDHLAFRQPDIDWQIWIEAGDQPAPRKLVITYRQARQSPQYTGLYSQWNFAPEIAANAFTFTPPEGAVKIDFLPSRPTAAKKPAK